MKKVLDELHNIQRNIRFNNYLIRAYNTFLSEKDLGEEFTEFLIKYEEEYKDLSLKDIEPVVKLLNEYLLKHGY